MKTILFQGDSITACGRDRDNPESLGNGYAMLAARLLEEKYPGQFQFVNRGVPGDWLEKVYQRRQEDILDVKPDYISLLVGVNDVAVGIKRGSGIDVQVYMDRYEELLCQIRKELPEAKLLLMEPFVNEGEVTRADIEAFEEGVAMCSEAVQLLCGRYDLPFLSLQFDLYELEEQRPAGHWTLDGVHPTLNFHDYMAQKWVRAFETYLNK